MESIRSATVTRSLTRYQELKGTLEHRRRDIESVVREQLHAAREERAAADHVRAFDDGEVSDADVQQDLEFALVQMKLETLRQIDDALARLETGRYGRCAECGEEIAAARLKALPFAVRCLDCEEARESHERTRRHSRRGRGQLLEGDAKLE